MKGKNTMTPKTFNQIWDHAVNLASLPPPIEANHASIQVPILDPRTTATAVSKPKEPAGYKSHRNSSSSCT